MTTHRDSERRLTVPATTADQDRLPTRDHPATESQRSLLAAGPTRCIEPRCIDGLRDCGICPTCGGRGYLFPEGI